MKKLILIAALVLGACSSPPARCLNENENARIVDMEIVEGDARNDPYTTLILTTDNKTVRVCRVFTTEVTMLKKGMVVRGFNQSPDWPNYNWHRIG